MSRDKTSTTFPLGWGERGIWIANVEKTISSQRIYQGRVINLRVDTIEIDQGKTTKREIVEHRGAVAMVPMDGDGNVVLVKQYRKAAQRVMLEIPAGTLELGEDPLQCAQRELEEEIGFAAATMKRIGGFHPCPGYSTEFIHLFLASDLRPSKRDGDEDESIDVEIFPFSRALDMVERGEIRDGKTIIGLLLAKGFQR